MRCTRVSCLRSTAATSRPTSRCSTRAARLLALVRAGGSSPHYLGVDGCVELLEGLLAEAVAGAGLGRPSARSRRRAQIMVAGADLPEELAALRAAIERAGLEPSGWSSTTTRFALLRSGTDRGWGVAVVCGGGINCVGLAPDGREARFPSLGPITGDWGGGYDVGMAALMAAARSADGRGPRTILERAVPAYFELREPFDVARAVHLRRAADRAARRAGPGRVRPAAEDDPVAAEIVRRLADEVIALRARGAAAARAHRRGARRRARRWPAESVARERDRRGSRLGSASSPPSASVVVAADRADRRRRVAGSRRARRRRRRRMLARAPSCTRRFSASRAMARASPMVR